MLRNLEFWYNLSFHLLNHIFFQKYFLISHYCATKVIYGSWVELLKDSTMETTQSHSNLKIIFWDWCDEWMRGCKIRCSRSGWPTLIIAKWERRAWGREITEFKSTDRDLDWQGGSQWYFLVSNLGGSDCPLSQYCFEQQTSSSWSYSFWTTEECPRAVQGAHLGPISLLPNRLQN